MKEIKLQNIEISLAYATENNITGRKIYKNHIALLHEDALKRLEKASIFAKYLGYTIKIFDAFRPLYAQQALWDAFPSEEFVSHPQTGKRCHCRGIAIDLTLVDKDGTELDMFTGFDSFEETSHHDHPDVSARAARNREWLRSIMHRAGFEELQTEWWHYQLPNYENYPIVEGDLM
jgi:D-alanyl-D-alanine dipeptidase